MNDMSLKAKIRNISKEKNISAQSVLQNYLMNRFLYRLSLSEYKEKFIIKGGMLISSIIGIEHRATMDIDTTLKNLMLEKEEIIRAFNAICATPTDDGINFSFDSIVPIRGDDEYGGYRLSFTAIFGKIHAPMSMDISTGDVITPSAELHLFYDMFDKDIYFNLWAYPIETILAEKIETILSRGIDNTRPRDFYDVYKLMGYGCNKKIFKKAFEATALHRESLEKIINYEEIINSIADSLVMSRRWNEYVRQMPYACGISFFDTLESVRKLLDLT